jgi:hypothetical protein
MTATITSARVRELSAKATGGEWRISRFSSTSVDKADGRRGIATTGGYQSNREVTLPENEANAALIAAAPEMADVLSGTTGAFMAVLLENLAARLVMLGTAEDDDLVVEARHRAAKTRALLARIRGDAP